MPDPDQTQLPEGRPRGSLLTAGQSLGQYKVIRLLGRGGMGEVYEVEHAVLHRHYALKVIRPEVLSRPSAVERFQREAQVMNHLEHPHIVQVDEFGETEGHTWLRMPLLGKYVDSSGRLLQSLEERMADRQQVPEAEVIGYLKQILSALDYAHGKGAIHRDIKPANILFDQDGSLKIADFGLVHMAGADWLQSQVQLTVARSMAQADDADVTRLDGVGRMANGGTEGTSTQALLGTFEFMSPEQKRGGAADARSDLYAVGLVAFRMLTGQDMPGFEMPSELVPELNSAWDKWIKLALAPNADRRFETASVMLDALPVLGQGAAAAARRTVGERILAARAAAAADDIDDIDTPLEPQSHPRVDEAVPVVESESRGQTRKPLFGFVLALLIVGLGVALPIQCEQRVSQVEKPQSAQANKVLNLIESAEQGDADAQVNLGWIYANGTGVKQDAVEAVKWFRLAAEQGNASGQHNLGLMYQNGEGVKQDYVESVKWYRLSADQGDADAQNNLGRMYANGRGVKQDAVEAVKWYRLSADQGSAPGQNNLGLMYKNGNGVAQDDTEAVKWCRLAAEQGERYAQYNLGLMYQNGEGVAQDDTEAVKWYRLSADQGNVNAQNDLGWMYDTGRGVKQDDVEAVKWYRLAAEEGNASGQYNLGLMYQNGEGVAQDDTEAVKWYRLAADQGHSGAQENLGSMSGTGTGVKQAAGPSVKKSNPKFGSDCSLDLGGGEKLEMVWVSALNGWVGKYEVTNGQYRRFDSGHNSGEFAGYSLNGDAQPAVQVSYNDAVSYCNELNDQFRDRLPGACKFRLPTGSEWLTYEQCGDRRLYAWGNSRPPQYGNYKDLSAVEDSDFPCMNDYRDGHAVSAPVFASGRNEWGLYGVGGNVWEWNSEPSGSSRSLGGGSWNLGDLEALLRCEMGRLSADPANSSNDLGFRVVLLR